MTQIKLVDRSKDKRFMEIIIYCRASSMMMTMMIIELLSSSPPYKFEVEFTRDRYHSETDQ